MVNDKPLGSTLLNKKKGGYKSKTKTLGLLSGKQESMGGDVIGGFEGDLMAPIRPEEGGSGTTGSVQEPTRIEIDPNMEPTVHPPYPYDTTDNATCRELMTMITNTNYHMQHTRMTNAAIRVYMEWMAYANGLYNKRCNTEPEPAVTPGPITTTPIEAINPVQEPIKQPVEVAGPQPTTDNPPVAATSQVIEGEPGVHPDTDKPDIIQTLIPPVIMPYGGPGGGGGGSADAGGAGIGKNKNWLWLAFVVVGVTGYILYNPKKAA